MNFISLCNPLLLLVLVMTLLYEILQKEVPQTVTELLNSLGLEKYLVLFQAEEVTFEASITKLFASIYLNIFVWVISHILFQFCPCTIAWIMNLCSLEELLRF